MSRRRWSAVALCVGLVLAAGACADPDEDDETATAGDSGPSGEEAGDRTTTTRDLFVLEEPTMHPMAAGFGDLGPERPVPDMCKPVAAGLTRQGEGYLLVIRMAGDLAEVDEPPVLPFGVLLHILEVDLGVFVPGTEDGGSYRMMLQYQFPDRQPLERGKVDSGKAEAIEELDHDMRGDELRLLLPTAGSRNAEVGEWGVTVSCALRHPVDSFYFPSSRLPATPPARLPL